MTSNQIVLLLMAVFFFLAVFSTDFVASVMTCIGMGLCISALRYT
jgi:Flp pilus assembly protein protease CpaA